MCNERQPKTHYVRELNVLINLEYAAVLQWWFLRFPVAECVAAAAMRLTDKTSCVCVCIFARVRLGLKLFQCESHTDTLVTKGFV